MARSAKRPDPKPVRPHPAKAAVTAVGAAISRNPALVGGTTAFLVAMSYVSANALWYQPFEHPQAFFSTRIIDHGEALPTQSETTIRIERPEPAAAAAEGDVVTKSVQLMLKQLDLYDGEVDGLSGPNTRKAVEAYQRLVGLEVTGAIDETLLSQLDTNPTAGITPQPKPKPARTQSIESIIAQPTPARYGSGDNSPASRIRNLQAGLRKSGRTDIDIDGLFGARTRAALVEFQKKNGLPETGSADDAVFAKMRQKGLIE